MAKEVRVRFAPSPTGPLHIGGVRTALYNYLFAKKVGGKFLLRLEDTDQTRFVPGAEDYIYDSLEWCGLTVEEGVRAGGKHGPYRQSERKDIYRQYAMQLVESGNAYYAFDTPTELEEMREKMKKQGVPSPQYNSVTRQYMKNSVVMPSDEVEKRLNSGEPYVIRFKMPRKEEVKINDLIRGNVIFSSDQLDDKVLFKSDGMPTYHLANVVDDHLMEITHVIRGEEWLPSTPLHVLLYRYLGWEVLMPEFAHLPLILRPDGKGKLSKRDGDKLGIPVFPMNWVNRESGAVSEGFRERGFLPEAFINMLAFLGWNPGIEQEIFTKKELVESFSIERIGKAGARFDYEKAKWFNQQFLKSKADEKLADAVMPVLKKHGVEQSRSYVAEACRLLKERVHFIPDFFTDGKYFFEDQVSEFDQKIIKKKFSPEVAPVFDEMKNKLAGLEDFSHENVEKIVKEVMQDNKLGFGQVLPVLRVMLCGTVQGPPIFEVAALLGRKTVVRRMGTALELFPQMN